MVDSKSNWWHILPFILYDDCYDGRDLSVTWKACFSEMISVRVMSLKNTLGEWLYIPQGQWVNHSESRKSPKNLQAPSFLIIGPLHGESVNPLAQWC